MNKINNFIMNNLSLKKYICFFVLIFVFFNCISLVQAAPQNLLDENSTCIQSGKCQISDLMQVGITVTSIILGLTGTAVLVAFVYSGFLFLVSAGSSERVTQAKSVIKGAIIGMLVVFLSFTIITQVFKALGVTGNWWESNWFN